MSLLNRTPKIIRLIDLLIMKNEDGTFRKWTKLELMNGASIRSSMVDSYLHVLRTGALPAFFGKLQDVSVSVINPLIPMIDIKEVKIDGEVYYYLEALIK